MMPTMEVVGMEVVGMAVVGMEVVATVVVATAVAAMENPSTPKVDQVVFLKIFVFEL